MGTIFDTDFADNEEVVLYRGAKFAWSGKVGDMTEELKREFDVSTWFLLDKSSEGFKALFIAQEVTSMADEKRSVYAVLADVQHRLTCPKGRVNKFGGYSYRSLEDINAALKPLCEELRCGYLFKDEIIPMCVSGEIRWYLKATATFWAEGSDDVVSTWALAREQESKNGIDDAQMTGLASSYARKYAACALFAIDSGEEVDAMDNGSQRQKAQNARSSAKTAKPSNTTDKRQTARQEPPQPATQQQTDEILTLVGQLAELKGKTVDEVVSALNKSQHMASLGVAPNAVEYDKIQAATAIRILASWVEKSR